MPNVLSKFAGKSGEQDDQGTVPFSVEPATSSAPLSLPSLSAGITGIQPVMNADCWRALFSHFPIRKVLSRALICNHWNNLVDESNIVRKSLVLCSRQDVLLYGPVQFFLFSRLPRVDESVFAAYFNALFNHNNQIQCLSTITDFATHDWLPVLTTFIEPLSPRTGSYISMHFSNIRRLYLMVHICPKVLVNLLNALTTEPDGTTPRHRLISLYLHVTLIFGEQADEQKDAILISLWRIVDSIKTLRQLSLSGPYCTTLETYLPNVLLQLTEFGLAFNRNDMLSLLSRMNCKVLKKLSFEDTLFSRDVMIDLLNIKFDFSGLTHLILGQDSNTQPVNEPFLQVIVRFCPNLVHLDMKSMPIVNIFPHLCKFKHLISLRLDSFGCPHDRTFFDGSSQLSRELRLHSLKRLRLSVYIGSAPFDDFAHLCSLLPVMNQLYLHNSKFICKCSQEKTVPIVARNSGVSTCTDCIRLLVQALNSISLLPNVVFVPKE